jgi:hypothetical protein
MTPAGPVSPCINLCSLDEQGYCRGCYRSRDEIAGWGTMSPQRQWEVMRDLEARRPEARKAAAG